MNLSDFDFPPYRQFHIAFVTPQLEAGMATFSGLYGKPEFSITRQAKIQTEGGHCYLDFAVANMDGLKVELIEPKGGDDGIYREALPAGNGETRFHHIACEISNQQDWDRVVSIIERNRLKTPIGGRADTEDGVFNYVYVDLRHVVGHYLEFVYIEGVSGGRGKTLAGA